MSDCCEDTQTSSIMNCNPQSNETTHCSVLGEVCSPLGLEMTDLQVRYDINSPYKYIPYFYRGDVSLDFFDRMAQLSNTHGSIIKSQVQWAVGMGLRAEVKTADGWAYRLRLADDKQTETYRIFLEDTILNYTEIDNAILRAGKNYKQNGNIYLELVLTETAGVKQASIFCHDSKYVRYVAMDRDALNKEVYLSQSFEYNFLATYPPKKLPIYPNFTKEVDGVSRTIIHFKNEDVGSFWYGKMDSIQGLYDIYKQYQLGDYTTKGYAMDWSAKVFIETNDIEGTEHQDSAKAQKEWDSAMKDMFSNSGTRRKTVLFRNNPSGEPTRIHEFKTQKDHEFDKVVAEMSRDGVFMAHDWHIVLMDSIAGKLGGSSDFMNIVELKYLTVIRPLQRAILKPFQTALSFVESWVGFENSDKLVLGLKSLMEELIEVQAMKAAAQNTTQPIPNTQP